MTGAGVKRAGEELPLSNLMNPAPLKNQGAKYGILSEQPDGEKH